MVRKHEGIYTCGVCKKETPIEDDVLIPIIECDVLIFRNGICDCGRVSSKIIFRFKATIDTRDWKFRSGSTI